MDNEIIENETKTEPNQEESNENADSTEEKRIIFKKPDFKLKNNEPCTTKLAVVNEPSEESKEVLPVSYEPPPWSGPPCSSSEGYKIEVLKNGSIVETIDLMSKPYWIFGRFSNCDIVMQHPTISRHHAVLQFNRNDNGFHLYDLESTHGTFLNKRRIRPRSYMKVKVGHMIKLGCSTRNLILNGPEKDSERETEMTYTELKRKHDEAKIESENEDKNEGIDWGMGEDADEVSDLSHNPFAQTTNEQLYLDDPKKTLRGFFEREGLNLEYDCSEQGFGQFLCKVELPIDDEQGRPIFAEVLHKGKKKDCVVQCALEACRVLDMHGLLRQAEHESRKRKTKNWADNDYYDSDDDTFLDRTGDIEKKREKRMIANRPKKAETYETLIEKEKNLSGEITNIENELDKIHSVGKKETAEDEGDSLDSYMKNLEDSKPDKARINKLRSELSRLKQEYANVIKLVNIAKPTSLPDLKSSIATKEKTIGKLPMFGKRKKIKVQVPVKTETLVEEEDEED